MTVTPVSLIDTFDQWRTKTNQLIIENELTNALTVVSYGQANTAYNQANAAYLKANTTSFTSNLVIVVADNSNAALRITQTGTSHAIRVEDAASDALPFVVDASGNVGIGIVSPTSSLHVVGTANITTSLNLAGTDMLTRLNSVGTGANNYAEARVVSTGTAANNYTDSRVSAAGTAANNYTDSRVAAAGTAANNYTDSRVAAAGSAANTYTDSRVATARTVLSDAVDATRYIVFANGTSGIASSMNVNSSFTFNPSTGTVSASNFNSTSDINLKYDIEKIDNALDLVGCIDGIRFKWKSTGQKSIGVSAQNIEMYLPELVNETNGIKTVNYDGIIGVLIESIKQLKQEIAYLKSGK
jgi:hypothetical protein